MVVLDDTVHLAGGDDGAPALRRAPVGNSPEHSHPARFRPGHSLRGRKNLPQGHSAIWQEILLEEHRRLAKITITVLAEILQRGCHAGSPVAFNQKTLFVNNRITN